MRLPDSLVGSVSKTVLQATHRSVEIVRMPATRESGIGLKILLATVGPHIQSAPPDRWPRTEAVLTRKRAEAVAMHS